MGEVEERVEGPLAVVVGGAWRGGRGIDSTGTSRVETLGRGEPLELVSRDAPQHVDNVAPDVVERAVETVGNAVGFGHDRVDLIAQDGALVRRQRARRTGDFHVPNRQPHELELAVEIVEIVGRRWREGRRV